MRKPALAAAAIASLILVLAGPAAADSPLTASVEWAPDAVADNQIAGTLGTITVTSVGGTTQKTSATVDWSAAEGTNATAAGGVSSDSAAHLVKPAGNGTFVVVNFSQPVLDPVLFVAHGTPGTSIFGPLGVQVMEANNFTMTTAIAGEFTEDATGSIHDGLAIRYPGTRSALSFSLANTAGASLTITVALPSSIAEDVEAETVVDTPVTVVPTITPATGRTVDPSTTRLIDEDGNAEETLVAPDGTYAVDTGSGAITFTPAPGFTGVASPVQYRVTDSAGVYASAWLEVTVVPVVGVPMATPLVLIGAVVVLVPTLLLARRRATV